MENVVAYLKDHWQYVVIAGGGLTLLGAIFNWRWVTSPDGERPNDRRTISPHPQHVVLPNVYIISH